MGSEPASRSGDIGTMPRSRSVSGWNRIWRPFWVLPLAIVASALLAGFQVSVDAVFDAN